LKQSSSVAAEIEEPEMKCPVCKTADLLMTERQGIEIDYCGTCRGVWLDRGELEKLIERTNQAYPGATASAQPAAGRPAERRDEERHQDRDSDWGRNAPAHRDQRDSRYAQKKKKSLLGDLFDFD
jgi:Zn-finger nucleic acid-binding protein